MEPMRLADRPVGAGPLGLDSAIMPKVSPLRAMLGKGGRDHANSTIIGKDAVPEILALVRSIV